MKIVAEIPLAELSQVADVRDLLDKRQGDGIAPEPFVIPSHAVMTVKTESRPQGQMDRGPYERVPVALVFTWET